jgi:hypothetical protein
MKLPWAPLGHMLLFLIEEAFQLVHRVPSLVSGQSAICNGSCHVPLYRRDLPLGGQCSTLPHCEPPSAL